MLFRSYTIIQTVPSTQIWTYEVNANSEEEAIEMVKNGDVECSNYEVDDSNFMDAVDFIVEDIEDIKE